MGSSKPLRASTMGKRRNLRASSNSPPPPTTIGRSSSTRALHTKITRSTRGVGEPFTPRNYTFEEKKWIFEQAERVISGDRTWEDVTADFNVTYNRTKEARMIKSYYTLQQREIKHGRGVDPRGANDQSSTEIPASKKTARRKLIFVDPAESDDRDELGPDITPKGKVTLSGPTKSDAARTIASKSISEGRGRPRSVSDAASSDPGWVYESGAHKRKRTGVFASRTPSPEETEMKARVSAQKPGITLRPRGDSKKQVLKNSKLVAKPKKAAKPVKESDDEDESDVEDDWVEDAGSEDDDSDDAEIADLEGYQESTASIEPGTDSEKSQREEEEAQQSPANRNEDDKQGEVADSVSDEKAIGIDQLPFTEEVADSVSDEKAVGIEQLPFTEELDISANEDGTIGEIDNREGPENEEGNSTSGGSANTSAICAREIIDLRNDADSNSELSKVESPNEEIHGKSVTLKSVLERQDDKDDESEGEVEDDKDDDYEEATEMGFVTPIPINFGQNLTAPSISSSLRKTTNEIKHLSSINLNKFDLEHSSLPLPGHNAMVKDSVGRADFDAASQADVQKQVQENLGNESVPVKHFDIVYQDVVQTIGIDNSIARQVLAPPSTDKDNDIQAPVSPEKSHLANSLTGRRKILKGNSVHEEVGKAKTSSIAELAVGRGRAKKGLTSPKKLASTNTPGTAVHSGVVSGGRESFSVAEPSGEIISLRPLEEQSTKPLPETEELLDISLRGSVGSLMTFAHARRSIGSSNSLKDLGKDMERCGNREGVAGIDHNARESDTEVISNTNEEKTQSVIDQGIFQTLGAVPNSKKNTKRAIPQALESSIESAQLPIKRVRLAHAKNENTIDQAGAATTCGVSVGPIVIAAPTDISPPSKTQVMFAKNEGGIRRIYVDRGAIGTSVPSAIPGPITWRRIYEERASLLDRVLTTEFRELVEALKEGKSDRRLFIYTCSQSAIEWVTVHHLKARKTQWRTQWGIQVPPRDQALIEEAVKLLEERKNSGKETEFKRVWGGQKVYEGLILEAQREYLEAHGQASSGTNS